MDVLEAKLDQRIVEEFFFVETLRVAMRNRHNRRVITNRVHENAGRGSCTSAREAERKLRSRATYTVSAGTRSFSGTGGSYLLVP